MDNFGLLLMGMMLGVITYVLLDIVINRQVDHKEKEDKDRVVSCNTCKFLLNKSDAVVIQYRLGDSLYSYPTPEYYCKKCKPLYDYKVWYPYGVGLRYYKEIEVDINGNQINK